MTTRPFRLELDRWPIVICTVTSGMTDEDYDALLGAWQSVLEREGRFVAITNTHGMRGIPNAAQRATIASWRRKMRPLLGTRTLGTATVIDSPLARGAMTALAWVQKFHGPTAFFGTLLEACDWCIGQLQEGGVEVTPAIKTWREQLARDSS